MSTPKAEPSRIAAIVLAAGRGTRFGPGLKLLAPLDGKPLVRHVAEAALASEARPVLVVAGVAEAEIRVALAGLPVRIVPNPRAADGLSTSLRSGWAALPGDVEGALILLGDMPLVSADLLARLIAAWIAADRPAAAVPTFEGRRGNPVLVSRALTPAISGLGGDTGLGPVLRRARDVVEVAVPDHGIVLDVDTPEGLAAVQAAARTTPSRIAE